MEIHGVHVSGNLWAKSIVFLCKLLSWNWLLHCTLHQSWWGIINCLSPSNTFCSKACWHLHCLLFPNYRGTYTNVAHLPQRPQKSHVVPRRSMVVVSGRCAGHPHTLCVWRWKQNAECAQATQHHVSGSKKAPCACRWFSTLNNMPLSPGKLVY